MGLGSWRSDSRLEDRSGFFLKGPDDSNFLGLGPLVNYLNFNKGLLTAAGGRHIAKATEFDRKRPCRRLCPQSSEPRSRKTVGERSRQIIDPALLDAGEKTGGLPIHFRD